MKHTESQIKNIVQPLTAEQVERIKSGIKIDDTTLMAALTHYKQIIELLSPHGDRYGLVIFDARMKLETLESMWRARAGY